MQGILIGEKTETITAVNGLLIIPNYNMQNHPKLDVLVIAGGQGSKQVMENEVVLNWIKTQHELVKYVLTVCSGSRLLAKLNLLDNMEYCTHHQVYEHIQQIAPTAIPNPTLRYIQSTEKIITSAGISAGIDASFYVLEKLFGEAVKNEIAGYMEYEIKE